MTGRPDVIVVGGGVIGVATAWALARAGVRVDLLERDGLAAHASGRNQGLVIGPHPPEMAAIATRGIELYEELHERSGHAFFFDRMSHGCLMVGEGDHSEHLARADLAAVEPLLGPSITSGWLNHDARRIDPAAAVVALAEEARAAGANIRTGVGVRELLRTADHVTGVLSDDGRIEAGVVIVAAGPWSWRVCRSTDFDVPVRGVRGWLVVTRPAPFRLRHALEDNTWGATQKGLGTPTVGELASGTVDPPAVAGLIQQDGAGRLLLGASLQTSATDDPEHQDEAVTAVCRRAAELVPAVASLPIVEIRSCRRPMSDDGLPLHGPVPGMEGLILATGHGSQGITWGIGSGEAVAAGVLGDRWDPALAPARFAEPAIVQ
ncbi:MAG: FAD-binding oxidoreductase [Actinomycetota bacterium]|nr:FAD-binding oxidoreductase [Actinomycetota bacterium]